MPPPLPIDLLLLLTDSNGETGIIKDSVGTSDNISKLNLNTKYKSGILSSVNDMQSFIQYQIYAAEKSKYKAKAVVCADVKVDLSTISGTDEKLDNSYNITMRTKGVKNNPID